MKFGRTPILRKPAEDGDDGGGDTTTIDSGDGAEEQQEEVIDRGDEVDPALSAKDLKKVAGEAEEEEEAPEATDPPGGKKGSSHVPIGRFNEVNEAKKALERENAELKAKAGAAPAATPAPSPSPAPKPKFDEDKAEREYMTLLAEGEFDKAAAIRKQINANLRDQAREEAEQNVEQRIALRQTTQTLTQVAEQAVKDFPYLDTADGADTMELILAARRGYEASGMPAPQALKAAVDKIAPKFAPEGSNTPAKVLPKDGAGADSRTTVANARGADASTRQPERLDKGSGGRAQAGKLDVETMTEEQFDALTPAEKSRLRGDA